MKKDYETMTVGEIVADNFGNAEVFDSKLPKLAY